MNETITLAGIVILAFMISIPCGYLRENFKKFSPMWFFMVHIPIPIIIFLRIKAGFGWQIIPLTLGGAVAGQIVGGITNRRRKRDSSQKK